MFISDLVDDWEVSPSRPPKKNAHGPAPDSIEMEMFSTKVASMSMLIMSPDLW